MSLLLILLVGPSIYSVGGAPAGLTATSISVSVNPSKLPADGLAYAAVAVSLVTSTGQPTVALSNTTVFLSVSQSNVGTLPGSVNISAGQTFVIANFTTTTTPGTTTITASSAGLASSAVQLTTATPSGFPDHIQVFATPSTLLARPSDKGTLILELTDDQGLPAKAPSDLTVQLFSSDASVVALNQNSLTIPANHSLASGSFSTSFSPGSPSITASASGYVSGDTTISVVGPAPLRLVASAQPSSLVINSHGLLMIELTDQSGDPAQAPSAVNITLRSSNVTVATIQNSVQIPAGAIYTWVNYTSTQYSGTATLTASSPGLAASSTEVKTSGPVAPVGLKVLLNPQPVLSDNEQYNDVVVVELMSNSSLPAVAANTGFTVSLSSSSSQVGSVPSTVTITIGSSYAVTYFQSTYASGTTTITASATNLNPDHADMTTFGPVPFRIALSVYGSSSQNSVGTELPADGGSYPALAVSLLDSSGGPAIAPGNIVIQLSSSRTDIVSVDTTVTIPQGSIYVLTPLQTSNLPGAANLTASSVGLTSGGLTVSTEIPAPTKLAAFLAPAVVLEPKTGNAPYLYIQLQDSNGNPARARVSTPVIVTSSDPALFNTSMSLTIPQGADYARMQLQPLANGSTTLTASTTGLASATATLKVLPFPFSVTLTLSQPGFIYANQTDTATLSVTLLGQPLSGVNVTWTYSGVAALPINGTTNSAGELTTVLTPVSTGVADISATATGASFGHLKVATELSIIQVPPTPKPTLLHDILSYIYYIIAVIAVAIVGSVFLLRRRRRHAKAELEAGFEAVS